jgi:hypothetical protein
MGKYQDILKFNAAVRRNITSKYIVTSKDSWMASSSSFCSTPKTAITSFDFDRLFAHFQLTSHAATTLQCIAMTSAETASRLIFGRPLNYSTSGRINWNPHFKHSSSRKLYILAQDHSIAEDLMEAVMRSVNLIHIVWDFFNACYQPDPIQTLDGLCRIEVRFDLQRIKRETTDFKRQLSTLTIRS